MKAPVQAVATPVVVEVRLFPVALRKMPVLGVQTAIRTCAMALARRARRRARRTATVWLRVLEECVPIDLRPGVHAT
jgi:hypothetical protein